MKRYTAFWNNICKHWWLAINTLFIGDDSISGNVNGGVNLPDGTSIGDAENVISSGIFNGTR